ERGEVVVRVAVRSREQQAVRLEVSVQDTGIGIAPENHARIFSGFTQAEASTTRRFGGTGLGVAICQRLVQMMGGDLQLDSALGRGSRFWFEITLPLADEASCASTLEAPAAPGAGRLAGLRLLVAEDNANNQQVARELLEDEGAEVHIVGNGLQAVNAVARASPTFDAVLMDLQMPEMDGYTATSRIRQDLGRQVLPIVAMTANAMASDREACLAAGMNDHIGKPFDLNQLVAILRRVTRRDAAPAAASPAVLATPPLPQAQQALAAAAGVDLAAALHRMGGRVPTYRRLLGSFVRDLDLLATDLQVLRAEGRWDEAKRQAHTVKGLAGTLGAMALSQRAAAAEHALASETAVEAAAAVQAFCDEVAQARPALAQLCAGLDDGLIESTAATASGAAGAAALGDALRVLARLLSDADMDAVAALERLRQDHAVALGDRLEPLEDAVAQLDFERALVVCRAMLEASRA
ncbi:MAG: response regulator, partial [Rubrivivax sp.]|nr:response regulator [Rubrivivax sp.]